MRIRSVVTALAGCCLGYLLAPSSVVAVGHEAPVADAVQQQNPAAARALLKRGADVNAPQPDGATALHWAAHWDDRELADALLRSGARVDAANDYGVTPLSLAATNGSAAMVALLLNGGANVNAARATGETVLMTASRTGNVEVVKLLLARGAAVNAQEASRGQTAVMWAAAEGHAEVIRTLVEHRADLQGRSKAGFTPLLFAAREGRLAAAQALIAAGADVNATAADGSAALLTATVFGHQAVAELLLANGADPNADRAGYTALHWAAGTWETTLRFDDDTKTNKWYRLGGLKGAAKLGLIRALLARGADPNARTRKHPVRHGATSAADQPSLYESLIGATPFLLAAHAADADAMRLLAAAGANPLTPTVRGVTPLMEAAGVHWLIGEAVFKESDALEAVKVALELGADINAASDSGDTALHGAAITVMDTVVQFLAERGADVNAVNKDSETPLIIAEGKGINRAGFRGSSASTAALLRTLGALEQDREVRTRYSDLVRTQRGIQAGGDDEKAFQESKSQDPRVKK